MSLAETIRAAKLCLDSSSKKWFRKKLKMSKQQQSFHANSEICGLSKATWHVLLNDFRPGQQRADTKLVWACDTDHMQGTVVASEHTVQTTESGSSHRNRGRLSRHSSPSVSTMTHLCSPAGLLPSPGCLSKHTGLCHSVKPLQTAFVHDSSLSIRNPSLIWGSACLIRVPLVLFLYRNKTAVEEVAHPRGWKLVSHPTLKAVFTQNIVSVPKHVKGSYS